MELDSLAMGSTTIDNLDIKSHTRYAIDQALLDPKFIDDVQVGHPNSAIDGFSFIYSSELEKLFELQNKNKTWATFSPPSSIKMQKNRYFTHRIVLGIIGDECDDQEYPEEENPDALIKKATSIQKEDSGSSRAFENERLTIINMLGQVKQLNKMLEECNAKRLQYQKG